jgi:hypothetical protein
MSLSKFHVSVAMCDEVVPPCGCRTFIGSLDRIAEQLEQAVDFHDCGDAQGNR